MSSLPEHQLIADGVGFEFESPYDLWPERIGQLRRAHQRYCACRPQAQLRLAVVDGESGSICSHIRCLDGPESHAPDCIFRRWARLGPTAKARFPHSIFAPQAGDEDADSGFALWARGRIARCYHEAFVHDGCVSARGFLSRIRGHSASDFYPAIDPVELAKRNGLRIVCGVASPFITPLEGVAAPSPYWHIGVQLLTERGLAREKMRVPIEVLSRRLRAISIFDAVINGPYVFVALMERVPDLVVRLFLLPIALEAEQMCTVDSDAERRAVVGCWRNGAELYKPLTLSHLNQLPVARRSLRMEDLAFRYRPDWLCFNSGVEVVELCGFPNDAAYMRAFAQKAEYWLGLQRAGHIRFRIER